MSLCFRWNPDTAEEIKPQLALHTQFFLNAALWPHDGLKDGCRVWSTLIFHGGMCIAIPESSLHVLWCWENRDAKEGSHWGRMCERGWGNSGVLEVAKEFRIWHRPTADDECFTYAGWGGLEAWRLQSNKPAQSWTWLFDFSPFCYFLFLR